jgi:hypothetical protein
MKKYNKAFCVRDVAGTKKEMTFEIPELSKKEVYEYVRQNHPDFVVKRIWYSQSEGVTADFMSPNPEAFV